MQEQHTPTQRPQHPQQNQQQLQQLQQQSLQYTLQLDTEGSREDGERRSVEDNIADSLVDRSYLGKGKRACPDRLSVLERIFSLDPLPSAATKEKLGAYLGMSPKKIQIWFQVGYTLKIFLARFSFSRSVDLPLICFSFSARLEQEGTATPQRARKVWQGASHLSQFDPMYQWSPFADVRWHQTVHFATFLGQVGQIGSPMRREATNFTFT